MWQVQNLKAGQCRAAQGGGREPNTCLSIQDILFFKLKVAGFKN
jgi:hypothetical protein